MEKIKAKCALCGAEKEIIAKPEPKTKNEKKQVAWHCKCGARMRRDGTYFYEKGLPVETNDLYDEIKPEIIKQPPPDKSNGLLGPLLSLAAVVGGVLALKSVMSKKTGNSDPKVEPSPEKSKETIDYLGPVR